MISRFAGIALYLAAVGLLLSGSQPVRAQAARDSVVIGMALEPPGLDPTAGAAAAIGEITHFNIFEGLTRIDENGAVHPYLAESWTISPDYRTYTFKLKRGVSFQNGEPLSSADVKFSFERAGGVGSTNKDKAMFADMTAIETPDPTTAVIHLKEPYPDLLFHLGLNTAVIVDPKSAANNAATPVGTGPYKLQSWNKGASATLTKWQGYRDPAAIRINSVTFRFISDPSAQVAALLAGDIDAFPRFGSYASVAQFPGRSAFQRQHRPNGRQDGSRHQQQATAVERRACAPRDRLRDRSQGADRRRALWLRRADRQPLHAA